MYLVKGGNLFRGGRVRWVTDYIDAKNYVLSELDDNNLTIRDVVNGKSSEHAKFKHNVDSKDKAWAIEIEISPDRLIQRIQKDQQWITLDTWTDRGAQIHGREIRIRCAGQRRNRRIGLQVHAGPIAARQNRSDTAEILPGCSA